MKKILPLLLSFMLLCACNKIAEPTAVAEGLCSLFLKGEAAVTELIPELSAASISSQLEAEFMTKLKENLKAVGADEISEEQLKAVVAEIMEARKRVPFEVETVESGEDKVTLQITVGTINSADIDNAAAELAQKALENIDADPDVLVESYLEEYLDALKEGFAQLDPGEETKDFTVDFIKAEKLWLPQDMNSFVSLLAGSVMG